MPAETKKPRRARIQSEWQVKGNARARRGRSATLIEVRTMARTAHRESILRTSRASCVAWAPDRDDASIDRRDRGPSHRSMPAPPACRQTGVLKESISSARCFAFCKSSKRTWIASRGITARADHPDDHFRHPAAKPRSIRRTTPRVFPIYSRPRSGCLMPRQRIIRRYHSYKPALHSKRCSVIKRNKRREA